MEVDEREYPGKKNMNDVIRKISKAYLLRRNPR